MARKILFVVMCLVLSFSLASAVSAQVDDGFAEAIPDVGGGSPPPANTGKPGNTGKPKGGRSSGGHRSTGGGNNANDDTKDADKCGGRGEVEDIENPGQKRCKTLDEWWAEKINPVKEQAEKEAKEWAINWIAFGWFAAALVCLIISLILRRRTASRIRQIGFLAADNRDRLDGANVPHVRTTYETQDDSEFEVAE